MKNSLKILMLLASTLAFGQKKELKAAQTALEAGSYAEVKTSLTGIDKSTLKGDALVDYNYLIGAAALGKGTLEDTSVADLQMALDNLYQSATATVAKGAAEYNKTQQLYFVFVNDLLRKNDNKTALTLMKDLVRVNKGNNDILESAAEVAQSAGENEYAETSYAKLLEEGYTGETETMFAIQKSDGKKYPFSSKTELDLAVKTGQFENPTTEKSASAVGNYISKYIVLLTSQNKMDEAKAVLAKAKSKYPNDATLKEALPAIYLSLDMMEEYKAASGGEIKDPGVLINMGVKAYENKKFDEALELYNKALAIDPVNFAGHVNSANAWLDKGNAENVTNDERKTFYTNSVTALEKAVAVDATNQGVNDLLLQLYGILGLKDKEAAFKAKM